jgi:hypothetical protein
MTGHITLPRAEAEQIRAALVSGKKLYAALAALDAALKEPDVADLFAQFAAKQRPLDADMAAIINANLDSLYITDEPAAALAEPEHIHTCGPDCQKPLCVNRRREIAAAVEAEREAVLALIEAYKVPVGNSAAGEMACEWTMDALRDLHDAIRARGSK